MFFFFKQKTAYEMRISDWSSDVCSSDLLEGKTAPPLKGELTPREAIEALLTNSGLIARFENGSVVIASRYAVPSATPGEAEPIIVTGSRIAGAPAAAPVIEVTSEDIRNAGQTDLGEVARRLDRKSVVNGKSVSVRVERVGGRNIKKK